MPRSPIAILTLVSLGLGAQALGQTTTTVPTAALQPSGPALSIADLVERLTRDGYRDFREVERKGDKLYKVDASDAQGRSLELSVDARTAEVLASEGDDED